VEATAAAASDELPSTTILGIVLGLIFGLAILLMTVLFCIKRARRKRHYAEAAHARRASGIPDEKNWPQQDVAHATAFRGHAHQNSANSFSSIAILMGKMQKPTLQRKASNDTRRSSTSSIYNKDFKSTIGRPQFHEGPDPGFVLRDEKSDSAHPANVAKPRNPPALTADGSARRSSGWNRYWSGGSTLNILGFGNANGSSQRETVASEHSSRYSDMNRMTQDSATVPPLKMEGVATFNRVNSGSPTVSTSASKVKDGMAGQIERPVSPISSDGYSSGIPASVHDNWDPTVAQRPREDGRPRSSTYSQFTGHPSRPPTGVSRLPPLDKAATSSDMSWLNLDYQRNSETR
jgi:hypothetical protein